MVAAGGAGHPRRSPTRNYRKMRWSPLRSVLWLVAVQASTPAPHGQPSTELHGQLPTPEGRSHGSDRASQAAAGRRVTGRGPLSSTTEPAPTTTRKEPPVAIVYIHVHALPIPSTHYLYRTICSSIQHTSEGANPVHLLSNHSAGEPTQTQPLFLRQSARFSSHDLNLLETHALGEFRRVSLPTQPCKHPGPPTAASVDGGLK